jgi:hypothetical protein
MMELARREGLKGALVGREEKQSCSVFQFVIRYFNDMKRRLNL